MNRVSLVGRITADPQMRTAVNNTPYVFFNVAINRLPLPDGSRPTDFISCIAWNRQAENLCRFIKKGGLLGIEGSIQSRQTTDQNGQKTTIMEVACDRIEFLDKKENAQGTQGMSQGNYNYGQNQAYPQPQGFPQPQYNNGYNQGQPQYNNQMGGFNNPAPRQNESYQNQLSGSNQENYNSSDDLTPDWFK